LAGETHDKLSKNCKTIVNFSSKSKYLLLMLLVAVILMAASEYEEFDHEDDRRLSVRAIGNDLLNFNQDARSVVPPVDQMDHQHFLLHFDRQVVVDPDDLADSALKWIGQDMAKRAFIQVMEESTGDIVYEFKIDYENGHVIPCTGRILPESTYTISVEFNPDTLFSSMNLAGLLTSVCLMACGGYFFSRQVRVKSNLSELQVDTGTGTLRCGSERVKLTDKEMEIFRILQNRENELVAREDLLSEVWYDKGVITGRSLDTYISRLRKKLGVVSSMLIVNEHGKGYRLENKERDFNK
jgi:DNA-binding winged helix-turn-helix (wHTH) protein